MELKYIVKDKKYLNINQILEQEFNISNRLKNKLIKNNKILLNNIPTDTRTNVNINDIIIISLDFKEESENIIPAKIILNIIYEDDSIIAINKTAGIAIHPSILHYTDSLSNGVKYYFNSIDLKTKIRPINRLDLNTSGIVLFAKNEYIQECLIKQMNSNIFKKEYLAIICGQLDNKSGTINAPISRKENSIIERCVNTSGKSSITHYEVIKSNKNISLIKCILETGRTHQIRVHFSYINHPLLCDTLYGVKSDLIDRQALHAYKVHFIHPITKKIISLEAEIPNDMKKIIDNI